MVASGLSDEERLGATLVAVRVDALLNCEIHYFAFRNSLGWQKKMTIRRVEGEHGSSMEGLRLVRVPIKAVPKVSTLSMVGIYMVMSKYQGEMRDNFQLE